MSGRVSARAERTWAAAALVLLLAIGLMIAGGAQGERAQRGNLVFSLEGQIAPLKLPRDHPAPISVHLVGGLRTVDGSTLPRVTRIELGLPRQGVLDTRGLPVCTVRKLRSATTLGALESCGDALVGDGRLRAEVVIPDQAPLSIDTRLLAFNGTIEGRPAVLVHAYGEGVPVAIVIRFAVEHRGSRLGTVLVARLPRALGPWPRLAHFDLTLSRRFEYRGRRHSYLSASCPIPASLTAGFFSLARAGLRLAGGGQIGTSITRSCRGS